MTDVPPPVPPKTPTANSQVTAAMVAEERLIENLRLALSRTPEPPHQLSWLEVTGMGVFAVAASIGLIMLLIGGTPIGMLLVERPQELWLWVRTGENMFRIAAIGILVAIVARTANPYVTIFGTFVIGALIIPTKDIMGFVAIFSDRQEELAKLYDADIVGPQYRGEDQQFARDVLASLEGRERDDAVSPPESVSQAILGLGAQETARLEEVVLRTFVNYQVRTIGERVRLRGSDHALMALYLGEFQQFTFATSDADKLQTDLLFLRQEGAITFPDREFEMAHQNF